MNTSRTTTKNNSLKSISYRGDLELKKMIEKEIEQLNKKKKGTLKISPVDLIKLCIPLITDEQRQILLGKTISPMDRQKVALANYKKKFPATTKIEFLGLVQNQEVDLNNYLPDDMKIERKTL